MSSSCRGPGGRPAATPARSTAGLLAIGILAVVVLGGCSIGAQDAPVVVSAPTASAASPTTRAGVPLTVQAYAVRADHVYRLSRTVPPGAGLEPALMALAVPLSTAEVARGLHTALPATRTPLTGELRDGVARIDVPKGFDRISVREQELAMAQLVFTITADTLASSVVLVQGDRELPVPDDSGRLVTRPVTRLDYAAYRPTS